MSELMVQAVEVERRNLPGSRYLEQFAKVCSDVVVKYAPAQHVKLVVGKSNEYKVDRAMSRVLVHVIWREITDRPGWVAGDDWWEVGVPLAEDKPRDRIGKDVRWVVWDGKILEIRV